MDDELQADPPAEVPVDVPHVPFLVDDTAAFAEVEAALLPHPTTHRPRARSISCSSSASARTWRPRCRGRAAPEGGVVVHCMGGKDRTGLLTALVLHLAGVDDQRSPPTTR